MIKSILIIFRLCLISLPFLLSSPLSAETYALLIGIDKYNTISNLQGAKNDANHIHQALLKSGIRSSNIKKLTDYTATRHTIKRQWTSLVNSSKPGDFLILSFAGHGTSVLDTNGDEKIRNQHDNHDEAFLLSKYQNATQTPNELLLDDDLGHWFDEATRLNRKVIFVADACFAGGGFRENTDLLNKGHVRYSPSRELAPPKSSGTSRPILQSSAVFDELGKTNNFLFISGVQSNQAVKEILLPNPFGQPGSAWRGGLSYAFAEAIFESLSLVDKNRDNGLSPTEIKFFIKHRVRELTGHNQDPDIFPSSGRQIVLQVGPRRALLNSFKKPNTSATFDAVISRAGLIKTIQSLSSGNTIELDLGQDIRKHYKRGDVFSVTARNLKYDHLLVFNIADNGLVECANHRHGERESTFDFRVDAPFGNDSLVLLNIQSPSQELLGLLGSEKNCIKDSDYLRDRLPLLLTDQSYNLAYTDRFSVE